MQAKVKVAPEKKTIERGRGRKGGKDKKCLFSHIPSSRITRSFGLFMTVSMMKMTKRNERTHTHTRTYWRRKNDKKSSFDGDSQARKKHFYQFKTSAKAQKTLLHPGRGIKLCCNCCADSMYCNINANCDDDTNMTT